MYKVTYLWDGRRQWEYFTNKKSAVLFFSSLADHMDGKLEEVKKITGKISK